MGLNLCVPSAAPAFVLKAEPAELLCFNGDIHTLEADAPRASVLACRGQELLYAGFDRELAARMLSSEAWQLDLRGLTVIPGMIDGHAHAASEGLRLAGLDLFGKSREEILDLVRREAGLRPRGQWILGHGWNQEEWARRDWPGKEELDKAAPFHPTALDRMDKHSVWVNSRALETAGIHEASLSPPGGEIMRDALGRVRGVLVGAAARLLRRFIPPVSTEERRAAILRAQAEFVGYGLTSVMDAACFPPDLELLHQTMDSGELRLRIRAMLPVFERHEETCRSAGALKAQGLYGERLSISGIKIMADGSLGSRSAWLLGDYADRPGHRGEHFYTDEQMRSLMRLAWEYDLAVAVHAIGDAAARQTIQAMRTALGPEPGDRRWRIEHVQVISREDMETLRALGVIPSIQTVGLISDLGMAEERLGAELVRRAYAWREFLADGGLVVNGSDCPVQTADPFVGMQAAVTRARLDGHPACGWYPEHKLSREEALKSYTLWAAWSEFGEARKGSLRAGKLADFAVLSQNPLSCPEDKIKDTRVELTVLGGAIFGPERLCADEDKAFFPARADASKKSL
ncbi:MAG: amidohydrolase [Deltaproteobacteria bacterium]|jgi:predicted amidohydrolase YtcJ|nr:amidohydrolase [Deltaproteobacteria bacterium]